MLSATELALNAGDCGSGSTEVMRLAFAWPYGVSMATIATSFMRCSGGNRASASIVAFGRSIRLTSGGERRVLIQPLIEARTSKDMTEPSTKGRLVSFLRITVCLMSFGFVFPYALMESTDAAKLAAKELLDAAKAAENSGA